MQVLHHVCSVYYSRRKLHDIESAVSDPDENYAYPTKVWKYAILKMRKNCCCIKYYCAYLYENGQVLEEKKKENNACAYSEFHNYCF